MPSLQIIRIRRKINRRAFKSVLSLHIATNQEALVEAQIQTYSGKLLSTLNRVQVVSVDSFSLNRRHQEVQLEGELSDKDSHQLLSGAYIVEVTATSPDKQKVTRHFPIALGT
ncbi:hypothetical protein [Armatimonas sp.]|uniref:hypothetical protein n=1 Tax=Armatimonas sp. TaxID=1872638 RepID=UPI00286B145C|nr:hypothetical protein [Armatimonas sp.]